jgi:hypothetical protein
MRTHLHMDCDRTTFDADMTTRDGYRVRVTSNPDLLGEAGYAGTSLHGVDALCGGLFDDSFEDDCAIPLTPENDTQRIYCLPHSQRYARGMPPRKPNIEPAKLRSLLTRKTRSAIPMSRIAEMASAAERTLPCIQHEEVLLFGFLAVTVCVERWNRKIVSRTLSGVPANSAGANLIRRFVLETTEEARDRAAGGLRNA